MNPLVPSKTSVVRKALFAVRTLVRLIACVTPQMHIQGGFLHELLSALFALVAPAMLLRVTTYVMAAVLVVVAERLVAELTFVRPLSGMYSSMG